jgi:predicted  nucleic acid-binding Zn-ribbon protein
LETGIENIVAGEDPNLKRHMPVTVRNPETPVTFKWRHGMLTLSAQGHDAPIAEYSTQSAARDHLASVFHELPVPEEFDALVLHCLIHDTDPSGQGWEYEWDYAGDPPPAFCAECGHVYGKQHRTDRQKCSRCPCHRWSDVLAAERRKNWTRDARAWATMKDDSWLNDYIHQGHWHGGSLDWDVSYWVTLHAHFDHRMNGDGDLTVAHMEEHGEHLPEWDPAGQGVENQRAFFLSPLLRKRK